LRKRVPGGSQFVDPLLAFWAAEKHLFFRSVSYAFLRLGSPIKGSRFKGGSGQFGV